jgi:hypothetical protein
MPTHRRPESWPEFFPALISGLQSGNPQLVHGAMRVLTEFTRDQIDTQQIPKVIPTLMPELYKIFADPKFDIRTRSRCVTIFNSLLGQLHVLIEEHPEINPMVAQLLHGARVFFDGFLTEFSTRGFHWFPRLLA